MKAEDIRQVTAKARQESERFSNPPERLMIAFAQIAVLAEALAGVMDNIEQLEDCEAVGKMIRNARAAGTR